MSFVVFGLGLLLSLGGAYAIYFGYGIVDIERGWATLIAGATALSGGIITVALALVLRRLGAIRTLLTWEESEEAESPGEIEGDERRVEAGASDARNESLARKESLERAPSSRPSRGAAERAAPAEAPTPSSAGPVPVQAPARPSETAAARVSAEDIRRLVAERIRARQPADVGFAGVARAAQAEPPAWRERVLHQEESKLRPASVFPFSEAPSGFPAEASRAPFPHAKFAEGQTQPSDHQPPSDQFLADDSLQAQPFQGKAPAQELPREEPARAPFPDLAGWDRPADGESEIDSVETRGLAIIGRYDSDGTTYIMYSDGSIEAQSDRGVLHFESMVELKEFMEAQGRPSN